MHKLLSNTMLLPVLLFCSFWWLSSYKFCNENWLNVTWFRQCSSRNVFLTDICKTALLCWQARRNDMSYCWRRECHAHCDRRTWNGHASTHHPGQRVRLSPETCSLPCHCLPRPTSHRTPAPCIGRRQAQPPQLRKDAVWREDTTPVGRRVAFVCEPSSPAFCIRKSQQVVAGAESWRRRESGADEIWDYGHPVPKKHRSRGGGLTRFSNTQDDFRLDTLVCIQNLIMQSRLVDRLMSVFVW